VKTPKDKYMNDPEYRHFVQMIEGLIEQARFTPSEIREMCMLACINYEMRHVREHTIDPRVDDAYRVFDDFISKPRRR
jgi:hypothetical protein